MRDEMPAGEMVLGRIGDGDQGPGDPADVTVRKRETLSPLAPPGSAHPYPIPKNQDERQNVVNRTLSDCKLNVKGAVAFDGLTVDL